MHANPPQSVMQNPEAVASHLVHGELPILEFKSVTKTYGKTCAIDNVSLSIPRGRIAYFFGLLGGLIIGPNVEYPFFPYQLLGFTQVLISIMSSMLLAFLAFTLGAAIANRHRVAADLAWYIGLFWFIVFFVSIAALIWTSYFLKAAAFS